jgi:predicted outer membrane protein
MRRAPLLACTIAILATLGGCRADGGSPQAERRNTVATDPAHHAPLGDAAILALTASINNAEIGGAIAAAGKLQDPSAVQFAQQLQAEHKAMNAALDSLPVSRDTITNPPAELVTMRVASAVRAQMITHTPAGPAFDRMWAALQVGAHGDALDSLRVWQQVAMNPRVKEALGAAMTRVSDHLERARALQSALGAGATPPPLTAAKPAPEAPVQAAPKPKASRDSTKG